MDRDDDGGDDERVAEADRAAITEDDLDMLAPLQGEIRDDSFLPAI